MKYIIPNSILSLFETKECNKAKEDAKKFEEDMWFYKVNNNKYNDTENNNKEDKIEVNDA